MLRTKLTMIAILATALALPSVARAQTFTWHVNYYDNSHTSGAPDAKVRIINSGAVFPLSPPGDICAMIYVFAPDQQLEACCGCLVTPNGLLTLSVNNNLNTNVLSPLGPTASGVIKVVESLPNVPGGTSRPGSSPTCDPGFFPDIPTLAPGAALAVEGTHIQDTGSGTFGTTDVQVNGSGHGRCQCPGEMKAALDPPPLPAAPVVSPTPVSLPRVSAPASTAPSLSTPKLSASNASSTPSTQR
ncbi:MAG: hypothetical protein DMG31_16250 [Acidobacteria bacterium]|nr:MAG: hypothetical protein DMG31_16250 [Acidobacteriota bacterium]